MRDLFKMETCSKCGMRAVAFICSTPGCPVNGGAAYGPAPTPSRNGTFEAAVRAGCDADVWVIDGHTRQPIRCHYPACGKHCPSAKTAEAALRAMLPPDPAPDEISETIGLAIHDVHEFPAKTYLARVGQAARRALRASLLPGEEPS